jgi:hypothetical protein
MLYSPVPYATTGLYRLTSVLPPHNPPAGPAALLVRRCTSPLYSSGQLRSQPSQHIHHHSNRHSMYCCQTGPPSTHTLLSPTNLAPKAHGPHSGQPAHLARRQRPARPLRPAQASTLNSEGRRPCTPRQLWHHHPGIVQPSPPTAAAQASQLRRPWATARGSGFCHAGYSSGFSHAGCGSLCCCP